MTFRKRIRKKNSVKMIFILYSLQGTMYHRPAPIDQFHRFQNQCSLTVKDPGSGTRGRGGSWFVKKTSSKKNCNTVPLSCCHVKAWWHIIEIGWSRLRRCNGVYSRVGLGISDKKIIPRKTELTEELVISDGIPAVPRNRNSRNSVPNPSVEEKNYSEFRSVEQK